MVVMVVRGGRLQFVELEVELMYARVVLRHGAVHTAVRTQLGPPRRRLPRAPRATPARHPRRRTGPCSLDNGPKVPREHSTQILHLLQDARNFFTTKKYWYV